MLVFLTFVTFIFPILAIPIQLFFLFKCEKNKKKYVLFLLSVSIGVIVFHLIPTKEMDLYRYYNLINLHRIYPVDIKKEILNNSDPITYFLIFFISNLKSNGFLPFVAVILYYNLFYISIEKILKNLNLNKTEYNKSLLYLLSISVIATIASGIRFGLATALFSCSLAFLTNKQRIKGYVFMVLSILSHSTLIFAAIIYLIINLKKNKIGLKDYIFLIIVLIFPSFLTKIISYLSMISFLSSLSQKLGYYYTFYFPGGTWYIFRIIIFILNLILLFKTKKIKFDNPYINSIINLQTYLAIISIFTLPYYNISIRFINLFNNFSIFIMIFNWYKDINKKYINLIIFTVAVLYGTRNFEQMKSYNFGSYSISQWFYNFFSLLK